ALLHGVELTAGTRRPDLCPAMDHALCVRDLLPSLCANLPAGVGDRRGSAADVAQLAAQSARSAWRADRFQLPVPLCSPATGGRALSRHSECTRPRRDGTRLFTRLDWRLFPLQLGGLLPPAYVCGVASPAEPEVSGRDHLAQIRLRPDRK